MPVAGVVKFPFGACGTGLIVINYSATVLAYNFVCTIIIRCILKIVIFVVTSILRIISTGLRRCLRLSFRFLRRLPRCHCRWHHGADHGKDQEQ